MTSDKVVIEVKWLQTCNDIQHPVYLNVTRPRVWLQECYWVYQKLSYSITDIIDFFFFLAHNTSLSEDSAVISDNTLVSLFRLNAT